MTSAARAISGRRDVPRLALLAAIGAAHLFAIWLLLQPSASDDAARPQPTLALFDVVPPPPPPPAPPPTAAPPPLTQRTARPASSGGSPGRLRERAARMAEAPAPPRREAMDVTASSMVPLLPAALLAGSVPFDLGGGGAGGTGSGDGRATGDGRGNGRGDGSGDVYGRADWLKRPSLDTWRRYWPPGRGLLKQPVTVKLSCKVRRNNRPYDCRVRSEQPSDMGFSATALNVLRDTRIRPVARNGEALWDVPVLVTIVADAIETAPRIAPTAAASAPRAR